jgi:hypothetical protein
MIMDSTAPAEAWAEAFLAAARTDLETRARLLESGVLFEGYHPEMETVHVENAALLEKAFDAVGWPGRSVLGEDAAGAAFLVLQHAISRPALQRRGLELLLEAIPKGDANALDAAYLSDRIAVFEGRPQLFGTQFDWFDGALCPAPVDAPDALDDRRASVGLPPIAEAIAEMRARGDGPAPADLEESSRVFYLGPVWSAGAWYSFRARRPAHLQGDATP